MTTVARDSINRRSRRFRRGRSLSFAAIIFDHWRDEMSNSDLIRKYFSAYENKDRKAVESLLTDDFVFTSPYDYRIDRETYFKRCWPYTEKSPTYGIEKLFEKGNEAFILYDCKTKNGGNSRNTEFFAIEGNKINKIKELEVYLPLPQRNQRNQRKQQSQKSMLRPNLESFRQLL